MADLVYETKTYVTRARGLGQKSFYVERDHRFAAAVDLIDVFPHSWMVMVAESTGGGIALNLNGEYRDIHPPAALFLPPYALARWRIGAGNITWKAYWSLAELPPTLMRTPFHFHWNDQWHVSQIGGLIDRLEIIAPLSTEIPVEWTNSPTAKRAKKLIDANYREDVSVAQLATQLNVTCSALTHSFSRCYGLSPLQYRNRLRVSEALIDITVHGHGVTYACYESGFEDFSRFYVNFRNSFGAKPSLFLEK